MLWVERVYPNPSFNLSPHSCAQVHHTYNVLPRAKWILSSRIFKHFLASSHSSSPPLFFIHILFCQPTHCIQVSTLEIIHALSCMPDVQTHFPPGCPRPLFMSWRSRASESHSRFKVRDGCYFICPNHHGIIIYPSLRINGGLAATRFPSAHRQKQTANAILHGNNDSIAIHRLYRTHVILWPYCLHAFYCPSKGSRTNRN